MSNTDTTTALAVVSPPPKRMSILRENTAKDPSKLPVSGIIRLGTKQISKKASENQAVANLYAQYKAGKITSRDAEKKAAALNVNFPFYPTNTQEFNVHPLEIEGGEATVKFLLEKYGEDRGNGVKLYRFPVMFPDVPNGIDGVFQSKFAVPVGAVKYWSEYGGDGVRYCMHKEPIDKAKQASRKKFMRRKDIVRGPCDPGSCAEFGSGACKFQGTLHFYIPGVSGAGVLTIKTGSTTASEDVYLRLEDLYTRCRGRLPNYTNDQRPAFHLTKVIKRMTYFEGDQEKISEQWVLALETEVDMTKILLIEETQQKLLLAGVQPASTPVGTNAPTAWLAQASSEASPAVQIGMQAETVDKSTGEITKVDAQPAKAQSVATGQNAPAAIDQIEELCNSALIEDEVHEWAAAKYSETWMDDPKKVQSVLDELNGWLNRETQPISPDTLRAMLPLLTLMYAHQIDPDKVGRPYLKHKKLKLQYPADFKAACAHLEELFKSGPSVAKATMLSVIAS